MMADPFSSELLCTVCYEEFDVEREHVRPIALICGHTVCFTCFHNIENCPICRMKNISQYTNHGGMKASRNYLLEESIIQKKQLRDQDIKDLQNFKHLQLCLDCKVTFDWKYPTIMGEKHEGHDTIPLGLTDDRERILSALWLTDFLKKQSMSIPQPEVFLQLLLSVAEIYQKHFLLLKKALEKDETNTIHYLKSDIKKHVLYGQAAEYDDPLIIGSLLEMRTLQKQLLLPLCFAS